jgi:hypothetical protein
MNISVVKFGTKATAGAGPATFEVEFRDIIFNDSSEEGEDAKHEKKETPASQ